ncbi:g6882 [Coccomyxa viridis]|uniref:G6882 protein n=1 Tax=Coccomyxa viridis TaxID=1274662 RepID=A0ABP1FWF5_9CHLO
MRLLLRAICLKQHRAYYSSICQAQSPWPYGHHFKPATSRSAPVQCRASSNAALPEVPKAAMLIIGNEILNGSVVDTNTPWLAKLLYSRGVDLVRIECVPDDEADIASTVLGLRLRVGQSGFVFTSGGIGATHDDVTYSAIASAFGTELQLHEPTVQRMQEHYSKRGVELNEARLRMATLPAGAEVLYTPELWVPLVNLQGVYILPGIPRLFKSMVEAHKDRFKGPANKSRTLYTNTVEGDLADVLRGIAAEHPGVNIGSYPNTAECEAVQAFRVKLQLESRDEAALEAAMRSIEESIECIPGS